MIAIPMSNPLFQVLITDRFDEAALSALTGDKRLKVTICPSPHPDAGDLALTEGLIIRSRTTITREFLAQAPKLKVVITATSGFNHIDLDATQERGIAVMHTPEANAQSAAELTWALVLACARHVPQAHQAVKVGNWKRETLLGTELSHKTYGIVGLGRIGSRVAQFARAFNMKVLAFDPYKNDEHFHRNGAKRTALADLMRLCDFVSLHVPATQETHQLVSETIFEHANPHLVLVNTSRGSAINENNLIDALQAKKIAGCGLDVFESEPVSQSSALLSLPNVILSPHIGATTAQAFTAASVEAAHKMLHFAKTFKTSDTLPPNEKWYRTRF
jgi:D-3-phosphoglycerate dehydrogenase